MRFIAWSFVVVTPLLLQGCGESPPPPPPPMEVAVVEVVVRDQPIVLEMVGETRGSADIPIRARVEGVLLAMHFTEGRKVSAGDLLYNIDPVPFESKVVEARGYLAQARTQVRPLCELADTLCQHLPKGGELLLSGILSEQVPELLTAYREHAMLSVISEQEGWVALYGKRK